MKKRILVLMFLIFGVLVNVASATDEPISFVANMRYKSQHISAGGFSYGEPAVVSILSCNWKDWSLGFMYFAKTLESGNDRDQIDWFLEYAKISNFFGRQVKLAAGIAMEDVHAFFKNNNQGDFWNYFLEIGLPFDVAQKRITVTPFVKLEFYTPVSIGAGGHGGSYLWLGLENNNRLAPYLQFAQRLAFMSDSGVYSTDSGEIVRYIGQLKWSVNKWITLNLPIVEASLPLVDFPNDGRHDEFSYGGSIVLVF